MAKGEKVGVEGNGRTSSLGHKLGGMVFKFWHGYTRERTEQSKFWQQKMEMLKIDGKVSDYGWVQDRQAELAQKACSLDTEDDVYLQIYARSWLEDYCRHQGKLENGRVVTRLPVYGADSDRLREIGIEVDSFNRDNVRPDSGHDYIVILHEGWSMRPYGPQAETAETIAQILQNGRHAGVFDSQGTTVLDVLYSRKPFPFGDSFTSRTWMSAAA